MGDIVRYIIVIGVLVYSCILHECAHVWSALKMGDPTGKLEGRLTLDPRPHFSWFWTFLLPLWTYYFAKFPVGGPKPAPVNPLNFENPRLGSMLSGLAGPAMNLLLAAGGLGGLWGLHRVAPGLVRADSYNALLFTSILFTNVGLAAVNLIPVPPLDGSRFLRYLLGRRGEEVLDSIERLGFIPIFFAFYYLGGYVQRSALTPIIQLLVIIFGDEYAEALLGTYLGR